MGSTEIPASGIRTAWQILEQARASGRLRIRGNGPESGVTFRAGFAVAARHGTGRFGEVLVRHGVAEDTVRNALRLQVRLTTHRSLGDVLAGLDCVGTSTLHEILLAQCREIIEACEADGNGTLYFEAADESAIPVSRDGGVCLGEIAASAAALGS